MKRAFSACVFALLMLVFSFAEIKAFELVIDDPNIEFQSKEYYMITVKKYIDLGFIDNAARDQLEAVKKYPNDIDLLLLYGDILYARKDTKAEYNYYSDLLKKYPNEAKIYIKRSYVDLDLDKKYQYLSDLLMADKLAPNDALVLGNIGLYYLENKDYDKAELYLFKSYAVDDKMTSTINNIACLYYYKGNLEKALEWINVSININDKNSYSYRIRGTIYEKLGMIEESKADFLKVK